MSDLELGEYAIHVEIRPGTLEALYDAGSLVRDETGLRACFTSGPAGCGAARELDTACCSAVVGWSGTTRFRRDGGRGGVDSFLIGVIAGDGRLATLAADAGFKDEALFEEMMRSVVFR